MDETKPDLSAYPLPVLVAEVKKRLAELDAARNELNLSVGSDRPTAQIKFQRQASPHKNKNKMRNAAVQRWEGWEKYKEQHGPKASRKAFFKAKREGKI